MNTAVLPGVGCRFVSRFLDRVNACFLSGCVLLLGVLPSLQLGYSDRQASNIIKLALYVCEPRLCEVAKASYLLAHNRDGGALFIGH